MLAAWRRILELFAFENSLDYLCGAEGVIGEVEAVRLSCAHDVIDRFARLACSASPTAVKVPRPVEFADWIMLSAVLILIREISLSGGQSVLK